jgi:hypothetical protein
VSFELLSVRELDDRRIDEIHRLLAASFARWPPFDPEVPPRDHLRWKMTSPGAEIAAVVGRAAAGASGDPPSGSLVASLTVVTQRALAGGRLLPRLRFIDQAVHPAARGRGLSTEMNRFVEQAIRVERLRLTDRGSHPAMVRLRERTPSRKPFGNPVVPLHCPLRPAALVRDARSASAVDRVAASLLPAFAVAARRRHRRASRRSGEAPVLAVREVDAFDRRCDLLWERCAAEFDVAVVRDASHLEWRYADPRGGRSTILMAEEGGELVGWAVLKSHADRAHLADLLVAPERPDALAALGTASIERAAQAGASQISCWLPRRHAYRRVLRRAGFVRRGRVVPLAYAWEGDGALDDGLLDRPDVKLHFTIGDSDFV